MQSSRVIHPSLQSRPLIRADSISHERSIRPSRVVANLTASELGAPVRLVRSRSFAVELPLHEGCAASAACREPRRSIQTGRSLYLCQASRRQSAHEDSGPRLGRPVGWVSSPVSGPSCAMGYFLSSGPRSSQPEHAIAVGLSALVGKRSLSLRTAVPGSRPSDIPQTPLNLIPQGR